MAGSTFGMELPMLRRHSPSRNDPPNDISSHNFDQHPKPDAQNSWLRSPSNPPSSTSGMDSLKPSQGLAKRSSADDIYGGTYKRSRTNSAISVDSRSDDSAVEETSPMESLRGTKEDIRMKRGRKQMELAPQELISALPIWKGYVSIITAQGTTGGFDKMSSDTFSMLHKSICDSDRRIGSPGLQNELVRLREMCEVASREHLSKGAFDDHGFIAQIDNIAKFLATKPELESTLSRDLPSLVLHQQPPSQVQANDALPVTCDPEQSQNVCATASAILLDHAGKKLRHQLDENTSDNGLSENDASCLHADSNDTTDDTPYSSSTAVEDVVPHIVLDSQPPQEVQANDALLIVARLTCDPVQYQNAYIVAFATLLSDTGEEILGKLLGITVDNGSVVSLTTTKFCFELAIPDPGKYRFRITLDRLPINDSIGLSQDGASYLHVDSDMFTVADNRGVFLSDRQWDLFDDIYGADHQPCSTENELSRKGEHDSERASTLSLVPLPHRQADKSEYEYDTTFVQWKTSTSSREAIVWDITYTKRILLIPVTEIINVETDLYGEPEPSGDGFSAWGEGLFSNKEGEWFEIDENEERSPTVVEEDEVLDGDDGRKYRKSVGCLQLYYVGLRRGMVIINAVPHIAHVVLVDTGRYCEF